MFDTKSSAKRVFSKTPSRGGRTRGGSLAQIAMRANKVVAALSTRSANARSPASSTMSKVLDAAGTGDPGQFDGTFGMARLHAGLAVEDDDGQVRRALHPYGRERAQSHQHLAISGDDEDAAVGLGDRQAEPDHCCRAHRTPEIKVPVVVADRLGIPGRRAEPGYEHKVAAIFE